MGGSALEGGGSGSTDSDEPQLHHINSNVKYTRLITITAMYESEGVWGGRIAGPGFIHCITINQN